MDGRVSGGKGGGEGVGTWICVYNKKDSLIKKNLSQEKLNNLPKATKLARSYNKFTPNIVCS